MEEKGDYNPEEEVVTGNWNTPKVSLKEVEVRTGEEDETLFWSGRSKLYRWVNGEWKERGLGESKLLKHKEKGTIRFLLRQEKTLKIVANHFIYPTESYCKLVPNAGSEKIYAWTVKDFAEEPRIEQFALKFNTPEAAKTFKQKFDEAGENNKKLMNLVDEKDVKDNVEKEKEKKEEKKEEKDTEKDKDKDKENAKEAETEKTGDKKEEGDKKDQDKDKDAKVEDNTKKITEKENDEKRVEGTKENKKEKTEEEKTEKDSVEEKNETKKEEESNTKVADKEKKHVESHIEDESKKVEKKEEQNSKDKDKDEKKDAKKNGEKEDNLKREDN